MRQTFVLISPLQADIAEPDLQQIAELLRKLPFADANEDYAILERTDEASRGIGISFLQTRPYREDGYTGEFLVEYRDGVKGRHYRCYVEAGLPLEALFASYLHGDGAWLEMVVWRDMTYQFDDLRAALPPEEFAASFFPDGEWDEGLKAKKRRDAAYWVEYRNEESRELAENSGVLADDARNLPATSVNGDDASTRKDVESESDYAAPVVEVNAAGERIIRFKFGGEKRIRAITEKRKADWARKAQDE